MCCERKMCKTSVSCRLFFWGVLFSFVCLFSRFVWVFCLFSGFLFCFWLFVWFSLFMLCCCVLCEAVLCSTTIHSLQWEQPERGEQEGKNQIVKVAAAGGEGKEERIFGAAENTGRNRSCCGHEADEWVYWFLFCLLGKKKPSIQIQFVLLVFSHQSCTFINFSKSIRVVANKSK